MTPSSQEPARISLLWAGSERAAEIAALHGAAFAEAWTPETIARMLDQPGATSLLAEAGDPRRPIGFVLGQVVADEAEVLSVGVVPGWQRRGVGKALIEGLMRAAKRAEARRLYLEVAADNVPALALYGRLGFTESRRRVGYYARAHPAPAVDALVLALDL